MSKKSSPLFTLSRIISSTYFVIVLLTIGFTSVMLEKKFTVKIYGQYNSPFISSSTSMNSFQLIHLYIKLKTNEYIKEIQYSWKDKNIYFFIKERIPLLNWYNGEIIKTVDQDGLIMGLIKNIEHYPMIIAPLNLDPRILDTVIQFEKKYPIKRMISVKPNIWKVELMNNISFFTDRIEQSYIRIEPILPKVEENSTLQLFNPWKIFALNM